MNKPHRPVWQSASNRVIIVLLIVAIIMCSITTVSFFRDPKRAASSIFYIGFADQYMDFFHCVHEASDLGIYQSVSSSLYPPLINLVYYGLSKLISPSLLQQGATAMRGSAEGMRLFWGFQGTISILFLLALAWMTRGKWWKKALVVVLGLISMPLMYAMERGNNVALSVFFVTIYLICLHDPSPKKRESGFLCLAIAANIKLYPALFGLLLILEKRKKEALRCIVYGLVLFFVPLLIYGGFVPFKRIIINVLYNSRVQVENSISYKISWINFFNIVCTALHIPLFRGLSFILLMCSTAALFFLREYWQKVLLITLMCIGFTDFSFVYNTLYLFPVLLIMMNVKKPDRLFSFASIVISISLFPLAIGGPNPFPSLSGDTLLALNVTTLIDCICVMVLTVSMMISAFLGIKSGKEARNSVGMRV